VYPDQNIEPPPKPDAVNIGRETHDLRVLNYQAKESGHRPESTIGDSTKLLSAERGQKPLGYS